MVVVFTAATSPVENAVGRAAFTVTEFVSLNGDAAVDLSDLECVFVEHSSKRGAIESSVTGDPVYAAAGGPSDENVYVIPVQSSATFTTGHFIRASGRPDEAQAYEILEIADGASLTIWADEADFDIVDGDTVEECQPSGVYSARVVVPVDDVLSVLNPSAELSLQVTTVAAAGASPGFAAVAYLGWIVRLDLDVSGIDFSVG